MNTPSRRSLQPSDFQVNKTWLAYRINSVPLNVENQEIDLYVLEDAASMFLFGNEFAPSGSDYPTLEDAERLLGYAHAKRGAWPSELLLPGNPGTGNSFARIARKHGVRIRNVPESQLSLYIKDTQAACKEYLGRGECDA